MVKAGHTVIGVAPPQTPDVPQKLAELGVRFAPVSLSRTGLNPLVDMLSLVRLKVLFQRECPDVVLSYTIKPVIYGSLAASWAGVQRIYALIEGLGTAFNTSGIKGRLLRLIAVRLYRLALTRCTRIFVLNNDIAKIFVSEKIAPREKVVVVPGAGIDTEYYSFSSLPEGPPVFLYLGRLLRDKGIAEFVAAARLVKAVRPEARFILMGETDVNPASFTSAEVKSWQREGVVEHQSFQSDVRPFLRRCTAYVLPSYHEGLSRSVLEAMATGRPIITTDTIGCRETIIDAVACPSMGQDIKCGLNGFLVPVRSVAPLAAAMEQLASDRPLAVAMGRESRAIALESFDARLVNELMLTAMNLAAVKPEK
jgi:glycosyltransferase involved in cell wall biosynthesis